MNRFTGPIFQVLSILLIVLAFGTTWTSADGLTLMEKQLLQELQQLRKEFFEMKDNLSRNDNSRLEVRVNHLEGKVRLLEDKIQQQEDVSSAAEVSGSLKTEKSTSIQRTCRETRAADPSLASGMYWIDPDGQGVGDDPINVYCDMKTGTTSVLHDSQTKTDVGHCADPGCYSKVVNYSATKRQMTALTELSNECHQSIKYDCVSAPFEISGVVYSWWNDKNGNAQYFWAGSNSSVHTCQCGIDHNCVEASATCNCDSSLPTQLSDNGLITVKSLLPITRLNFGRTILASSSGFHTLGAFECSGQVTVSEMPKSCHDLWQIGHTLSGLYSIKGTEMIETVYCDFTKIPGDQGFQTWIGYDDIKSSPIYFYVQRSSNFTAINTPLPFDVERLNIGSAINLTSGIFTAPRTGTYFFSLAGISHYYLSSRQSIDVSLLLNGNNIGRGHTAGDIVTGHQGFSIESTLNLKTGDKVWIQITGISAGMTFHDHPNHYTHFNGRLLQENIF